MFHLGYRLPLLVMNLNLLIRLGSSPKRLLRQFRRPNRTSLRNAVSNPKSPITKVSDKPVKKCAKRGCSSPKYRLFKSGINKKQRKTWLRSQGIVPSSHLLVLVPCLFQMILVSEGEAIFHPCPRVLGLAPPCLVESGHPFKKGWMLRLRGEGRIARRSNEFMRLKLWRSALSSQKPMTIMSSLGILSTALNLVLLGTNYQFMRGLT